MLIDSAGNEQGPMTDFRFVVESCERLGVDHLRGPANEFAHLMSHPAAAIVETSLAIGRNLGPKGLSVIVHEHGGAAKLHEIDVVGESLVVVRPGFYTTPDPFDGQGRPAVVWERLQMRVLPDPAVQALSNDMRTLLLQQFVD